MHSLPASVKVAVVGVGRMGRHHARTYANLPDAELVAVVDTDVERAHTIADEYGGEALTSVNELLARHPDVTAATIAVPTRYHADAARPLLGRGVACLIEKPLAESLDVARELDQIAHDHQAVLQVGHTERFNPAVRAVAAMNIPPRYVSVDRVSPMTFRSLDVGVVMDMMIHDLDIVLMLARSPLKRVDAVGIAVLGEHEDVAQARLVFESGCVASLTASRLALKTERKLRLFSEDAYVSLDYQKRSGIVIRKAANELALDEVRHELRAGKDLSDLDYENLVNVDELTMDLPDGESDPLTAELASFLHAVRTGGPPEVDARAGYDAIDAAQRVQHAIREHRWQGLKN
ncbi:MAG: Gfo/Idh/MocA family oxidoreductase [Phycisphaeraceae bacterium]